MDALAPLESWRWPLAAILFASNVAVWLGVYLEERGTTEEIRTRGWALLLRGLAVETAAALFMFAIDTSVQTQADEKIATLSIELQNAKTKTARADAILLREQRLTSNERWRLRWLEQVVIPRPVLLQRRDIPAMVEALKNAHFQPINLAIVNEREAAMYGMQWRDILQQASLLAAPPIWLPPSSRVPSLIVVAVDAEGDTLADFLFQRLQIGQGWRAKTERGKPTQDTALSVVPTDRNCLVIGVNAEPAWQPMPGQSGEGLDQNGRPDPPL